MKQKATKRLDVFRALNDANVLANGVLTLWFVHYIVFR